VSVITQGMCACIVTTCDKAPFKKKRCTSLDVHRYEDVEMGVYLSASPITGSIEPMIATTSETIDPSAM
jgi:hypothetical protein